MLKNIKETVLSAPEIVDIHDLIAHDYGPGRIMASVHAEVDSKADVVEAHEIIDEIEQICYGKTGIELVNKLGKNIIAKICFLIVFILLIVLELTSKSFSSIYLILIGGVIGIICYSILDLDNKGENK